MFLRLAKTLLPQPFVQLVQFLFLDGEVSNRRKFTKRVFTFPRRKSSFSKQLYDTNNTNPSSKCEEMEPVPTNDFSYLMYFLDCVHVCLPDAVPEEYRDYTKYESLTAEQKIDIVEFSSTLWVVLSGNQIIQEKMSLDGRQCDFRPTGNSYLQLSAKQIRVYHTLYASHRWIYDYYTRPMRDQSWRLDTDTFETRKQGMVLCRSARAKWDEARVVPEHSAFFEKKGGWIPNWKCRWFALSDQYLFYAVDNDKETNPQGVINLRGSFVSYTDSTTFSITTLACASADGKYDNSCRTFVIRGKSKEQVKNWVEVLRNKLASLKEHTKPDVPGLPAVDVIF